MTQLMEARGGIYAEPPINPDAARTYGGTVFELVARPINLDAAIEVTGSGNARNTNTNRTTSVRGIPDSTPDND